MSQQIETAAERYRRLKADRQVETFDFTSPSGMTWKLRLVDIQAYVLNGGLPASLATKLQSVAGESGDQVKAFSSLSPIEQAKAIEFSQKLVRAAAVSPRIVEYPRPGEDEIGYDEVETADFTAILQWVQTGGGEAGKLDAFHSE